MVRSMTGIIAVVLAALTTGCTMVKAVKIVGESIGDGKYLSAVYYTVVGVPVAAIVDGFTLGGALSAEESAEAIQAYQQSRQERERQLEEQRRQQRQREQQQQEQQRQQQMAQQPPTHSSAPMSGNYTRIPPKEPSNMSHCVRLLNTTDEWGVVQTAIQNSCAVEIRVAYCLLPPVRKDEHRVCKPFDLSSELQRRGVTVYEGAYRGVIYNGWQYGYLGEIVHAGRTQVIGNPGRYVWYACEAPCIAFVTNTDPPRGAAWGDPSRP